jgi:hypothetical protein
MPGRGEEEEKGDGISTCTRPWSEWTTGSLRAASPACGDRSDRFVPDQVLSRCGTDHLREPPEGCWAPGGLAGGAHIVPEQAGCEAKRGGLESAQGSFTGASAIAQNFVFDRGDRDWGEIARAHQPRSRHSVTPVGLYPVASLLRQQRRRHDPTIIACVAQGAREPGAAGAGFRDTDQMVGLFRHGEGAL